jgi:hypothetical protein
MRLWYNAGLLKESSMQAGLFKSSSGIIYVIITHYC